MRRTLEVWQRFRRLAHELRIEQVDRSLYEIMVV